MTPSSDVAFTPIVKSIQSERGSREYYAKVEARGGFRTEVTEDLTELLSKVNTAYLATSNSVGQPYAQHRGGPKGFIRMIDDKTLAFADFVGNYQYVTIGNLAENPKAFLFLMDYANRRRIKIWGRAWISQDPVLVASLTPKDYRARVEQAILFEIEAWDINCKQHIPRLLDATEVEVIVNELSLRIAELEEQNASLRALIAQKG
ncbi:pyridoxamine 5'-phosphate oxidase family protein [Phenylobacterium sp.]|jgi:predicted pyridoxine 5'-phosphate oxidase superfamily flavin-nucleotide-binding protein|uniref:pyridoxamine 5'-phosphate oxidase family protein n=1 Tax=Phenylobacterium sp. TaxID=1871053 RepID=UPI0025DA07E8|nr:pyridoxamine 5'-phosphate oxidase family protein [Phenylobacterium sp.]MCA3721555.1 pyridoxamine 5'-phosphate oxidase family protein [Phenylobacterium sp.]